MRKSDDRMHTYLNPPYTSSYLRESQCTIFPFVLLSVGVAGLLRGVSVGWGARPRRVFAVAHLPIRCGAADRISE